MVDLTKGPTWSRAEAENPKQKLRSLFKFWQTLIFEEYNSIFIYTLPLHIGPHQNLTAVCWIPQLLGCISISTFTLHKDRTNHLSEWLLQWFVQQARRFSIAWIPTRSCRVPQSARFETWKSFRRVYTYFYALQEQFKAHCFHLKYRWEKERMMKHFIWKALVTLYGKNRIQCGHKLP